MVSKCPLCLQLDPVLCIFVRILRFLQIYPALPACLPLLIQCSGDITPLAHNNERPAGKKPVIAELAAHGYREEPAE